MIRAMILAMFEPKDDAAELALVLTTVGSADDAERMAQRLVEFRLAACVQIDAIRSVYRWQGQVQHDAEWRLWCKTSHARLPALLAALRELHPYELPAIYTLAVNDVAPELAAWLRDSTGG